MTSLFRFILDPMSVEEFFANYYQKFALHISSTRDKFSKLFGWEAMNDILSLLSYPHPNVRMSQGGRQFRPKNVTGLKKAVQNGATLILKDAEEYSLVLRSFLDGLSGEINQRTRFNLYLSQPDNQAFNIHYDKQDAFILQITGYKEWWIFPKTTSSVPPPQESCYLHCTLGPGDVLYVPQGHWHYAIAREESSIHLTLAMLATSKVYLRQLFIDDLDATDGTETLWGASEVFTGFRDPDLLKWNLDLPGKATLAISTAVSEVIEDGTFGEIYGSLSDDLNKLRLSQAQIKHFARLHYYKFDPDRWATFLLFTRQDEPVNEDQSNLFVASVCIRDLKLLVVVRKFSREHILEATGRPRIVTPLS